MPCLISFISCIGFVELKESKKNENASIRQNNRQPFAGTCKLRNGKKTKRNEKKRKEKNEKKTRRKVTKRNEKKTKRKKTKTK